jgi:hypothetical protein
MVSVFETGVVDIVFDPSSGQTVDENKWRLLLLRWARNIKG